MSTRLAAAFRLKPEATLMCVIPSPEPRAPSPDYFNLRIHTFRYRTGLL